QEKKAKAPPQYGKVLIVLGILIAYYFAFQYIGYTIPTFLMIAGTAFTLGYRNWKVMIPTALAVSICLYLAFTQLFNVRFPGVFF
ncbi:MAG: tripartite tricarboxylate transporter TctB family protein, partial [Angelakisella sp.]|nr:tripartite tricarboxylate transporter TctB family protein [Angelakisella sp.]